MSGITVGTAVLISAGVAAASAVYSSEQAKKAQEKASAQREAAALAERNRLDDIARNTKPEEESATIDFGNTDSSASGGNYSDFLMQPSSSSSLGSSGTSGVGYTTTASSLGMK